MVPGAFPRCSQLLRAMRCVGCWLQTGSACFLGNTAESFWSITWRYILYLFLPSLAIYTCFISLISPIHELHSVISQIMSCLRMLKPFPYLFFFCFLGSPHNSWSCSFLTLDKNCYPWKLSKHHYRFYRNHYWGTKRVPLLPVCNRHTEIHLSSKEQFVTKKSHFFEGQHMNYRQPCLIF